MGSCVGPAAAMQKRFSGGPKSLCWTANVSLTQASAVPIFSSCPDGWAMSERELVVEEMASDW